jgi:phage terminase large subunit-like protein
VAKALTPADRYVRDVLDGKILACQFIQQACQRHLDDLSQGKKRGIWYCEQAAQHAVDFFSLLPHSKGKWAGKPFELSPWEDFIIRSIFGWLWIETNFRRFRIAYVCVPKKNGKSTLAAGIGNYLLVADEEPGAEIYTAATKMDQARIIHSEAIRMVKNSELREVVSVYKDNLSIDETASKYVPLGADAGTLDGLNTHGALIDELHAHKKRHLFDTLKTSMVARDQPLMFCITTAGTDRHSVCYEQHEYASKLLRRVFEDDRFFAYISTIDKKDDWTDIKSLEKANPNWGVSVNVELVKADLETAKRTPSAQNSFKRFHLNIWVQQVIRWLDVDKWKAQGSVVDVESLLGKPCYGGLDLASVSDMTAWVMAFPAREISNEYDEEEVFLWMRFWCPEERLEDVSNIYAEHYQNWAKEGFLTTTPGDALDYNQVKKDVLEDCKRFNVVSINIDRLFHGYQLSSELQEELEGVTEVYGMGQGYLSMTTPSKELERRYRDKKIHHGNNPVLLWMADNVAISQDPAGCIKPNKDKSQGKIDGIVAAIMALDRLMKSGQSGESFYEKNDLGSV